MTWDELANQVLDKVLDTFDATDAVYYPSDAEEFPIRAALSKAYVEVAVGVGAPVSSMRPIALVKLADLDRRPLPDDEIEIHEIRYRIIDSQTDGEGGLTLVLNRIEDEE